MKKVWGIIKVISGYILVFIICFNIGRLMALGVFKLIMWLGILPYLETFFGWLIWW